MSSKTQRKQAAAILGSAKTAKKAKAARNNGFKPKRKKCPHCGKMIPEFKKHTQVIRIGRGGIITALK